MDNNDKKPAPTSTAHANNVASDRTLASRHPYATNGSKTKRGCGVALVHRDRPIAIVGSHIEIDDIVLSPQDHCGIDLHVGDSVPGFSEPAYLLSIKGPTV